jgi:Amt family ammonium transporter
MYYVIGYNLMYAGVDDGYYGTPSMWSADDSAALSGDFSGGHAAASDWFFQMVFVATAASIVSGTVAERVKLLPFVVFVALLTGILYPITGSWQWGGGWLSEMGFSDFAGSTIVHSVGGWAALTGVLLIGPRIGRYDANGKPVAMPGSSLPLATLGTFILWLGWFGFNGGSQLELGSAADAVAVSNIFVNTNIAAAAGCVTAMALTHIFYKKTDITMVLNGALAGLVSITAEPLTPSLGEAAIIGAVGGLLVVLTIPMLDKFKIDDVVGAIPVHLICGIWGTIAVPITNPDTIFVTQLKGIMAIGAFTIIATFILWNILKFTVGIRISEEQEMQGIDSVETGMEAYPDFVRVSKR